MMCNFSEEMEETILEPIVKVKEEEMERKYHECNEFFSAGKKKILIHSLGFLVPMHPERGYTIPAKWVLFN